MNRQIGHISQGLHLLIQAFDLYDQFDLFSSSPKPKPDDQTGGNEQ
jgi:hypothetical protein